MEANRWSLRPPPNLDSESQAYVEAILQNIENDKRRCLRQHHSILAGEEETIPDASGQPFPLPEEDPLIPPLPDGFPLCRKPGLWIPPPRIGTPKREREGDAS